MYIRHGKVSSPLAQPLIQSSFDVTMADISHRTSCITTSFKSNAHGTTKDGLLIDSERVYTLGMLF